jgi:hypothetical protein
MASAFITLSLAAIIVGSSSLRCKIPLRRWGLVELVVETGEVERFVCLEKREEWRRGGSELTSSGAGASEVSSLRVKRPIVVDLLG